MRESSRCRRRPRRRTPAFASSWPPSASSAGFEAGRKAFGKVRFADRLLGASDVVADPAKLEDALVDVPDAVAGHRDPVTRLPDAAGVDQRRSVEAELVDPVVMHHIAIGQGK